MFALPDHDPGYFVQDQHAPAGHRTDLHAAQFRPEEFPEQIHPRHRLVQGRSAHAACFCEPRQQNKVSIANLK